MGKSTRKKSPRKILREKIYFKYDDVLNTLKLLEESQNSKRFNFYTLDYARRKCSLPSSDIIPHSYTYVAMELRKCILHHDWKNATRLVLMLLNGSKALEPLMWKMCVLVLFNHPMATKQLREDFVRMTTGDEDPEIILETLLQLNSKTETQLKRAKNCFTEVLMEKTNLEV